MSTGQPPQKGACLTVQELPSSTKVFTSAWQFRQITNEEALAKAGYLSRSDPVVIQCFDRDSLQRMRAEHGCTFPLVLCLRREPLEDDLSWAAEHCEGVAPHRKSIEDPEAGVRTDLITRAHELGLSVFPYTFGDEEEVMRRFFHEYGVEGVFTDYPDKGVAARARP